MLSASSTRLPSPSTTYLAISSLSVEDTGGLEKASTIGALASARRPSFSPWMVTSGGASKVAQPALHEMHAAKSKIGADRMSGGMVASRAMRIHRALLPSCTLLFVSVLVACGGSGNSTQNAQGTTAGPSGSTSTGMGTGGVVGTGGAGGPEPAWAAAPAVGAPFVPGPHGAAPKVIDYGGTVLASPKVQVISYASDPYAADVDAFVQELTQVSAPAWAAQTSEYGVGPLTVLPTISLTGTPPAKQNDNSSPSPFQQNLASHLEGASPAWGAADPSTIYLFILPMGSDISAGGHCCSDFLGYHDEAPVGNSSVPYAVICNCPAVRATR